ncbi:hypothetical protein PCANC_16080, partial [Puccinia coronata f. sp. avenae]
FSLVNAHTKNVLPSAHTCFNLIDLPSYNTYEHLRRMYLIAINEGSEGIGELGKLSTNYLALFVNNVLIFSSGLY